MTVRAPEPNRAYALPLRYTWILLGIIYFFPGVWKCAGKGFAWAFSENLKYRMHSVWFTRSFVPFFRIDQYPLLYQGAGAFTILFEIGFLFTLPVRSLRPWAAGGAFLFHESTRLFLAIPFWTLYPILPFLLDLRVLFVRLGQQFGAPLTLVYDEGAEWERGGVGGLLRMDLFDRLQAQERSSERQGDGRRLAVAAAQTGEEALWTEGRLQWGRPPPPTTSRHSGTLAVTVVGGLLIAANVVCGVAKINSIRFRCIRALPCERIRR